MGCGNSAPANRTVDQNLRQEREAFQRTHKLLLLGAGESGKSTILKQVKILFLGGFNDNERGMYREAIERNVISNMQLLIEACAQWSLPVANQSDADLIAGLDESDPQAFLLDDQVKSAIKRLWADSSVKTAWSRASETQVLESAAYFFESIDRLDHVFDPSTDDILRARQKTTGIIEVKFNFNNHEFRMVDVGGQRSERRKWLHCFEDCTAVIFCVALNEYDKMLYEEANVNRMHEASDLFREKIKTVDLKVAFPDYSGGLNYDAALLFLANKFKGLRKDQTRKTFLHVTQATNTNTVRDVLSDVFEILEDERLNNSIL